MSTPAEWYHSLPPITKAYGTACFLFTVALKLGLYDPRQIALVYSLVFKRLQSKVWSSIRGRSIRQENSRFPMDDDLWWIDLVFAAVPMLWSPFLGISLGFYLPWMMLGLDVIFGSPLLPILLGIVSGHIYYFLTVLHPLAGGKNILKTPNWTRRDISITNRVSVQ
ncbi:Derlin-1-like protein [Drosera capensis]